MMHTLADIVAIAFLAFGLFFMFVGAVGIVRLPDAYNRLHAASKCSTLGLMGLFLGIIFHMSSRPDMPTIETITKAVLAIAFIFVANPTGSHILAKAARRAKNPMWHETKGEVAPDPEG